MPSPQTKIATIPPSGCESTHVPQAGGAARLDPPASKPARGRRWIVVAGGVLLVAFLPYSAGTFRYVRDQFVPKRWGIVEPGKIYRSGQISARLIRPTLLENRIQLVVDLTLDSLRDPYHDAELATVAELGIERRLFPLDSDGTGDVKLYAAAVAAVAEAERAERPVLVHCYAGTQRTGGVIALYRLLVQGKPPPEVLAEMREYRYDPVGSPRLLSYLNEHMAELADELVRLGTIERPPSPLPVLHAD